jgi:formylglycine-generating enzyme required for sulfatase activity
MSGNVWEMVSDVYGTDYYATGARNNPKGPSQQTGTELEHVVRGGCASGGPGNVRTMKRNNIFDSAGATGNKWSLGFRLLKTP